MQQEPVLCAAANAILAIDYERFYIPFQPEELTDIRAKSEQQITVTMLNDQHSILRSKSVLQNSNGSGTVEAINNHIRDQFTQELPDDPSYDHKE